MNPAVKSQWVAALRSGAYKLSYGELRVEGDWYDPYGVLVDLAINAGVPVQWKAYQVPATWQVPYDPNWAYGNEGHTIVGDLRTVYGVLDLTDGSEMLGFPTQSVLDWAGLDQLAPFLPSQGCSLNYLIDQLKAPGSLVADAIAQDL